MLKLVHALRKMSSVGSIVGLFTFGCASGPVTTQIDKNKNPVVAKPLQFQSPFQAIDNLMASDASRLKDPHAQKIKNTTLKTLLSQQIEVANELKETGKLLLKPGISYEFDLEAFCVHAGVERPVKGDGLFLGDIHGAAKSWLPVILQNYKNKGLSQEDAQILIWSLLSGTHFDKLNTKNQSQLLKFFPDAPVRFGHSAIEDHAKSFLLSQVPTDILLAKEQFDKYQGILQDTRIKFSEIERTLSPVSSRSEALDVGWLKHEDGYYIHLEADGYQKVRVKIYAPEGIKTGTHFEPTQHVALPGEGQRLALSTIIIDRYKDTANQFIKNATGVPAKEALFILQHPLDAVKIYQAAQQASQATWSNFRSSSNFVDNKADAFRHFVWSGLVTHAIGAERAKEYLDAHEEYPENKPGAKSMDLYNNDQGIKYSGNYRGRNFEPDLTKAGLDRLRNGELKWIK